MHIVPIFRNEEILYIFFYEELMKYQHCYKQYCKFCETDHLLQILCQQNYYIPR